MKKVLTIFITMLSMIIYTNVYAEEYYYQNNNGVSFTKEEFEFLNSFYFEGYPEYMTLNDYEEFTKSNIMNGKIQIASSNNLNNYMPLVDVSYPTNKKTLKLSSSCSGTICSMAITLTWTQNPNVRSYDLIGSLVENTNITSRSGAKLYYSGENILPVEQKTQTNAISSTYKLTDSGSNIIVIENYNVNNSGKVIASYQHATQNISLATSRNYNFSTNGYGAVFAFYSGAGNYYDGMLGVYLMLG